VSIESVIERLVDFDYSHADHLGELGTYRREGSIVSITDGVSGRVTHIEWFDTEIDSIIVTDPRSGTRVYHDSVTIKHLHPDRTRIERTE
jgi:transcription-repair coupling factor (superfamily II helicase)